MLLDVCNFEKCPLEDSLKLNIEGWDRIKFQLLGNWEGGGDFFDQQS